MNKYLMRSKPFRMIAALGPDGVIGNAGRLPWRLPRELAFFKRQTQGGVLIMGRKTFESIGQKPLPGRPLIVLSRRLESPLPAGVWGLRSLDALLKGISLGALTKESAGIIPSQENAPVLELEDRDPWICGGARLYEEALPFTQLLYLSHIQKRYAGDTFFPDYSSYFGENAEIVLEDPDFITRRYEAKAVQTHS